MKLHQFSADAKAQTYAVGVAVSGIALFVWQKYPLLCFLIHSRSRIRYLDEHLPVLGVGRYGNDSFLGMFDGIMQ